MAFQSEDPDLGLGGPHHRPDWAGGKCGCALAPGFPHAQKHLLHLRLQPGCGRLPLPLQPHDPFPAETHPTFAVHLRLPSQILAHSDSLSLHRGPEHAQCPEHRALSVVWPIWYHYHRPRHLSAAICALLWALSLLLSFLEGYNCGIVFEKSNHYWCETFNSIIAGWTIVLCVVLSGSSLALLFRLFCSSRRMPLTRLYTTILLSVLVFLLCGLPLGILRFFLFSIQNDSLNSQNLTWALFILSGINSSTNPIIYFFVGSFRWKRGQTLQFVLQKALDDRAEVGKLGKRIPPETIEVPASHSPSNSLSTRVHSEK